MNKKKVEEILEKVRTEWTKRFKEGYYKNVTDGACVDKSFLQSLRKMLKLCPDEDGNKRVESMESGKVHLVPYQRIILFGIKQSELKNFPVENELMAK